MSDPWVLTHDEEHHNVVEVSVEQAKIHLYLDKTDSYGDEVSFYINLNPIDAIDVARALFERATAILELKEMTL